jgi:hypothetical protein
VNRLLIELLDSKKGNVVARHVCSFEFQPQHWYVSELVTHRLPRFLLLLLNLFQGVI